MSGTIPNCTCIGYFKQINNLNEGVLEVRKEKIRDASA
jgi:hypothetical protein